VTRAKKNIRTKSKGRHKRGVLHTAGKKRTWKPERHVITDDFYFCVVKRTRTDFYVDNKIVPSCNELLATTREKINFPLERGAALKENIAHHRNEMAKTSFSASLSTGI
jgi:hypothetical protein